MEQDEARRIIRDQADMGSLGHAAGVVLARLELIERRGQQVRGGYGPHRRPPEVVDFLLATAANPTAVEPKPVHPTAVTFAAGISVTACTCPPLPGDEGDRLELTSTCPVHGSASASWPRPREMSAAWEAFEACETCSAAAGRTCVGLRTGYPTLNPHPGRRQRGPRARS